MNIKEDDDTLRGIDFSLIPDLNVPLSLNAHGGSYVSVSKGQDKGYLYGNSFQKDLQIGLGLNLLNPIIFQLKQNAYLVDLSHRYGQFHLLRPKDLLEKEPFLSSLKANRATKEWERMSASGLYSLLFFDKDLQRMLKMEDLVLLGDALTFAWWKEGVEYAIMLQKPEYALLYSMSIGEQEAFFSKYHKNTLEAQEKGVYLGNIATNIKPILAISPWCSLSKVCKTVLKVMNRVGLFQSKIVRDVLNQLNEENDEYALSEFTPKLPWITKWMSKEKRMGEDQFLLAQAAAVLKDDPKHKELYKQCNELKRYSQIIDKTKTFGAFKDEVLAWGQQMQGEVDMGETVRAFVKKLNLAETVSDEVAGIISKTLHKLVGNLITSSEVMVPVLGYLWFIHRGGLFKYAKQAISSAIEHTVHGMLTSPGLTPTTTTTTKQLLPAG